MNVCVLREREGLRLAVVAILYRQGLHEVPDVLTVFARGLPQNPILLHPSPAKAIATSCRPRRDFAECKWKMNRHRFFNPRRTRRWKVLKNRSQKSMKSFSLVSEKQ